MPVTNCTHQLRSENPKREDKIGEAKGECVLFFVYRENVDNKVRNHIVRFSRRIQAYSGEILGVAKHVTVMGPEDSQWKQHDDWCVAAFIFPSQEVAKLWFISEPHVKQHDFPPPSDVFMVFSVPVRYIPRPDKFTFCWSEIADIRDKSSYQSDFVDKVSNLYDSKGVDHGLVFLKDRDSNQVDRLKGCFIPFNCHFRLDLFSSEEEFWNIHGSESYQSLQETRDCLSQTTNVVFTIERKMCM